MYLRVSPWLESIFSQRARLGKARDAGQNRAQSTEWYRRAAAQDNVLSAGAYTRPLLSSTSALYDEHVGWFQWVAVTKTAQVELKSGRV